MMSYSRKYFPVFFISLLVGVFTSTCNTNKTDEDKRTVFNYNEMAGVSSLDPAMASNTENIWPVNQLFNGLVQMNDSLRVIPCLSAMMD
jgi:ABC-type oligopeptide transport system substrate-binding subunit